MSKEIGAFIKSGAIYKSVKRVRELMKCEFCFNDLSQNRPLYTTDTIQLEWAYKDDCLPEDNKTNIYLATFTCWARLKLCSVLESVGRRVLYYDTDSVIDVSKPVKVDHPLGDHLGDLDPGDHIVEFVSGGPKNYCYKTNTGKEKSTLRRFTLNFTNSILINFDAI